MYICTQCKQPITPICRACIGHDPIMPTIYISKCNTMHCRCVHTRYTVVNKQTINHISYTTSMLLHSTLKHYNGHFNTIFWVELYWLKEPCTVRP